MTKYNEAFKRQLVQEYLAGQVGTRALSERHQISHSTLRRWIAGWQHHGQAGLRKKHETYSAEFKLKVLQRMWRDELSFQRVSALFDLREANGIARWERQYHEGGFEALQPRRKGRAPTMSQAKPPTLPPSVPVQDRSREDLLKENECLRAEVAYLKKLRALRQAKEQSAQKRKRKS